MVFVELPVPAHMFPIALNPIAMILMTIALIVVLKVAQHFGWKFVPGGLTLLVPDIGEQQMLIMCLQKATVEKHPRIRPIRANPDS